MKTKYLLMNKADRLGAGFVANVILNWHRNPTKKLAGLVRLLEAGKNVRTGQFNIDVLIVDGKLTDWIALESI